MPPPAAGVQAEDEGDKPGRGHGGGPRVSAVAAGGDGAGVRPPACCSVCMEPWTCYDAHRICCIPCGHVYGRSCLERWLQRCGDKSAKCPQCGEQFKHEHITNLYAPGNLWDGCCRKQEVEAQMVAGFKAKFGEELPKLLEGLKAEITELLKKGMTELLKIELISGFQEVYTKQLDQDVGAMVKAFESMKEQMKKMVEQNASPMDLMEFMEQAYTQLPAPSRPAADE